MAYQYPPQQPPQGYGAFGQPQAAPQGHYAQQPQYGQQPPYPQQQYSAPPGPPPQGQYPPQHGHYGAPPPGPPPQGYGAPPQHAPPYGAPPQQAPYGAPPHGAPPHHAPPYGTPSPQPGYNQPPPFQGQGYGPPQGAPPQGAPMQAPMGAGFNGAPAPGFAAPSMPSLGYAPGQTAPGNFRREAEVLRKAMKGFGTDEKAIIGVLGRLDPLQMAAVRATYSQHIGRDLHKDVKSETGGYLERGLLGVIDGPLGSDVAWAHESVDGLGTKEWLMNEALLGRSNADMKAIRTAYQHKYHRQLKQDISDDLSFSTAYLFKMVIDAERHEESVPLQPEVMKTNAEEIFRKRDVQTVCRILAHASNAELRAIDHEMQSRHRASLDSVVKDKYDGHMRDAFLFIVRSATDPAMRDAILLEEAMSGSGTKDQQLVTRVVRLHWNRDHKDQVKRAYRHKYKRDLIDRVRGETSGDYEDMLVALLQ